MLNALPGIREVRAPLAAGYLWLLNLWLITRAYNANENSLSDAFLQLGELTGTISLSVAIGFAAYLLGSLTEGVLIYLVGLVTELRVSNRGYATLESVMARDIEKMNDLDLDESALESEFLRRRSMRAGSRRLGDFDGAPVAVDFQFRKALLEDLDLVKTRLLEKHKEIFSASDRLNSEADLRFAVIPPMILLAGVTAGEAGSWWLFPIFLFPILLIGVQAWVRKRKGGDVLADALSLQLVESPASEDFALSLRDVSAKKSDVDSSSGDDGRAATKAAE